MHHVVGDQRVAWELGFSRRAPWKAFSAIIAFAICCVGLAAILVDSNGKEVNTWHRSSIIVDGPLIQRASTITPKTFGPDETIVTVRVSNASLPTDFSGYAGGGIGPDMLMPLFSNVSRAYANREAIVLPIDGCSTNATCLFSLPAPGFDVSCTESTVPYDCGTFVAGDMLTTFNLTLDFGGSEDQYVFSTINTTALYKPSEACSGSLIQRQCVLRLATTRYNVKIENGVSTIATWQIGQDDTIAISTFSRVDNGPLGYGTLFTGSVGAGGFKTMLGGIYLVAKSLFTSSTSMRVAMHTNVTFILSASGQAASNYVTSSASTYSNCSMAWDDPTEDLVNTIRELIFRSAIAQSVSNSSAVVPQQVVAQKTRLVNAYVSYYEFFAATVASMVFQALAIVLLLVGWQRLGRKVSLDAFEIAKALGAPLLQKGSSNGTIDDVLACVGRVPLRYGEILPVEGPIPVVSPYLKQPRGSSVAGSGGEQFAASLPSDRETGVEMEMSSFLPPGDDGYYAARRLALREEGRVGSVIAGTLY